MASISSAGIGSGLDVEGIISGLMSAERIPLTKITEERQSLKTQLSIYGIIKSSFADLQSAANKLSDITNLYTQKATSSDEAFIKATASSAATAGNYNIEVSNLARTQSVASQGTAVNKDDPFGSGSLTITLGKYDSNTNTFTQQSGTTPVQIDITAAQGTLTGIKQAINDADAGVSATIINDGTGDRLVLTSTQTGEEFGFKVDVTDTGDGNNTDTNGLSRLAYDPTAAVGAGNNVQVLQTALNANFTINNLAVSKSSNTFNDAIEGLTLDLKSATTGPINVTVALDNEAVKKNLDAFVSAYNKIRGNLKDQQEKDATLSRETTPKRLESGLRNILRQTVEAYGYSMSDIGMSFDRTGVLSLDSEKLTTALADDPAILEKIFADSATTTDARVSYLGASSNTLNGKYRLDVTTAYDGTNTVAGTLTAYAKDGTTLLNAINFTGIGNVATGAIGDYGTDPGDGTLFNGEDLQLSLTQSATAGNYGDITFSRGLASQLNDWINEINDEGGMLNSRTDGINGKISRLDDRETRFERQLEQIEKRYRAQFTALDAMLASMQQTSSYLSQQLAALSAQ